ERSAVEPEGLDLQRERSAVEPEGLDLQRERSAVEPEGLDLQRERSAVEPEGLDLKREPAAPPGLRRVLFPAIRALSALAIVVGAIVSYGTPTPRTDDGFDSARARERLRRILADERPHPMGSTESEALRERLVAEIEALGHEPEIQAQAICSTYACGRVFNVIVEVEGDTDDVVLVSTHYDSVSTGPGASDAGASVAVVVDLLASLDGRRPRNSVIFLINDGEEAGLLGARAFMEHHPRAGAVDVALNLEARGTSGPSIMFETGHPNRRLIELFSSAPDPVMNSLTETISQELPNDTDLTVYRAHGITGLNFAFIGDAQRYHRPEDTIANLAEGTLDHHGRNAMAAFQALAEADLTDLGEGGDLVYFDVYRRGVVAFPPWVAKGFAILGFLAALYFVVRVYPAMQPTPPRRSVAAALMYVPAFIGLAALLGVLTSLPFGGFDFARPWWREDDEGTIVALHAAGVLGAAVAALGLGPRAIGLRVGFALVMHAVLAIAIAFWRPPASYLFVVPSAVAALAIGIGLLPAIRRRLGASSESIAAVGLAAGIPALFLWLPVSGLLLDGLGAPLGAVVSLTSALAFGPLLAAAERREALAWAVAAGLAVAVGLVIS
ncbi:MAG: M28 family peptidase, partial [Myxococcota bacterium]